MEEMRDGEKEGKIMKTMTTWTAEELAGRILTAYRAGIKAGGERRDFVLDWLDDVVADFETATDEDGRTTKEREELIDRIHITS